MRCFGTPKAIREIVSFSLGQAGVGRRPGLSFVYPGYAGPLPASGVLLLPGDRERPLYGAPLAVTYGFSPRDTLSLSSIGPESCLLDVRRRVPLPGGKLSERGEVHLLTACRMSAADVLFVGAALFLSGCHMDRENRIYIHQPNTVTGG